MKSILFAIIFLFIGTVLIGCESKVKTLENCKLEAVKDVGIKDDIDITHRQEIIVQCMKTKGYTLDIRNSDCVNNVSDPKCYGYTKDIADDVAKEEIKRKEARREEEARKQEEEARKQETKVLIASLMSASKKGRKEEVESLLAQGADINAKDGSGKTPLMLASQTGHKDIVELLIDKGADVNVKVKESGGTTALILATFNSRKDIVELLLSRGADVNGKNDQGTTALILASEHADKEIVEMLLAKGADTNANSPLGTALMVASRFHRMDLKELLLKAGAKE